MDAFQGHCQEEQYLKRVWFQLFCSYGRESWILTEDLLAIEFSRRSWMVDPQTL